MHHIARRLVQSQIVSGGETGHDIGQVQKGIHSEHHHSNELSPCLGSLDAVREVDIALVAEHRLKLKRELEKKIIFIW